MEDFDYLFLDLPDDPHAASLELLQRVEKKIIASSDNEAAYSKACGLLQAFYGATGIKKSESIRPSGLHNPLQNESIDQAIDKARSRQRLQNEAYRSQIMTNHAFAVRASAQKILESIAGNSFGYAILSPKEKEDIRRHLDRARIIIGKCGLDDRKRNKLLFALADLVREVDRNGTRTDRFFAFASEVGFCLGGFAERAKPMASEVKEILQIVTGARARKEGIELPPGGEVLSLPEPTNTNGDEGA